LQCSSSTHLLTWKKCWSSFLLSPLSFGFHQQLVVPYWNMDWVFPFQVRISNTVQRLINLLLFPFLFFFLDRILYSTRRLSNNAQPFFRSLLISFVPTRRSLSIDTKKAHTNTPAISMTSVTDGCSRVAIAYGPVCVYFCWLCCRGFLPVLLLFFRSSFRQFKRKGFRHNHQ
jgi:hypothetical protein